MNFNDGQTAVFLKDLTGREYPAIADVNRKKRVNGQRELSLSFMYTEINKDFIYDLEFGWKVLFKGEEYTITHTGNATDGDYLLIDVTAILSFFVDLNGYYLQDSVENQSFTPANYFNNLFQGTPYSYVLVDPLPANTLNYQDNQSKTERFLYGIDRFGGEFTIRGRVAYIYEQVGNDKDVILHEDLNVNDVRIDVDASGFHTWAKGYGDLPEGDTEGEYQLEVEYVSPLVDKYGYIEGPAIKDGSYKHANNLKEAVKKQVENSYVISTEVSAVDLTNNGYPEMILEEGDRVFLVVDRLNLNQQVRVMEVDEQFNWQGEIIDVKYTLGNEGIASRYKTQQYNSIRDFRDITSGRKKLEYNWLPDAVRRASDIINGNLDSHFYYGVGEIIGINKNNPNGYMRFNTDGIGFSRDGGKTYQSAITYEGVVAESIIGGSIIGVNLASINEDGLFRVNGSNAEFIDNKTNRYVQISPEGLFGRDPDGNIRFQADRTLVTSSAFGTSNANVYLGAQAGNEARVVDYRDIPGDGLVDSYRYLPLRASGFYGNFWNINPAAGSSASNIYARPLSGGELRVTLNGTTDIYENIRVAGVVANTLTKNSLAGESPNLFIRPLSGGEVRVTLAGTTDNYQSVRADGYYGNFIDKGTDEGVNLYARPAGGGSLRVTVRGTTDVYRPVEASEFNNASSITYKTNIEDLEVSGLDVINNLEVKQYILKDDVDNGIYDNWQVGVISEVSPEIASKDGKSVNHNKWLGYLTKALQEECQARKALEQRVEDLEVLMEVI